MTQKLKLKEEVLRHFYDYRSLCFLNDFFKYYTPEKYTIFKSYYPLRVRSCLYLMRHFIFYKHFTMESWLNYFRYGEYEFATAHCPEQIENYILGLDEKNTLIWEGINLEKVLSFAKNKIVLDYGYGSGFYSKIFKKISKIVLGREQYSVFNYHRSNRTYPFTDKWSVLKGNKAFDIIWISDVFHGDSEEQIQNQIKTLRHNYLKKGGSIVVNTMVGGTTLSHLFNLHMKVFTSGGKQHSILDLIRIIGFKKYTLKFYPYYCIIKGEF